MTSHILYVGTIGEGVFHSADDGATFRRAMNGTFVECDVRTARSSRLSPGFASGSRS